MKTIAINKTEANEAFQAQVLKALEKSELSPHEIIKSDCRVCLMIKICGDLIHDKLKTFTNVLDRAKLSYNSSFSPKMGIMNISVFNKSS